SSMNKILTSIVALCLVLRAGQDAKAEDWPRWRGPRQDGVASEAGLLKSWPAAGPTQLWKAPLYGGFSSVVVADGRLFTQTKEKNKEIVLCVDAATGKEQCRYGYDCDYKALHTFTSGGMPASSTGPYTSQAAA